MTSTEKTLLTRIMALEYLTASLLMMVCKTKEKPVHHAKAAANLVQDDISFSMPKMNPFCPAESDLLAANVSELVNHVYNQVIQSLQALEEDEKIAKHSNLRTGQTGTQ